MPLYGVTCVTTVRDSTAIIAPRGGSKRYDSAAARCTGHSPGGCGGGGGSSGPCRSGGTVVLALAQGGAVVGGAGGAGLDGVALLLLRASLLRLLRSLRWRAAEVAQLRALLVALEPPLHPRDERVLGTAGAGAVDLVVDARIVADRLELGDAQQLDPSSLAETPPAAAPDPAGQQAEGHA